MRVILANSIFSPVEIVGAAVDISAVEKLNPVVGFMVVTIFSVVSGGSFRTSRSFGLS